MSTSYANLFGRQITGSLNQNIEAWKNPTNGVFPNQFFNQSAQQAPQQQTGPVLTGSPNFQQYKPPQQRQNNYLNALNPVQTGNQINNYMSRNNMYNPTGQNANLSQRFNYLLSQPNLLQQLYRGLLYSRYPYGR